METAPPPGSAERSERGCGLRARGAADRPCRGPGRWAREIRPVSLAGACSVSDVAVDEPPPPRVTLHPRIARPRADPRRIARRIRPRRRSRLIRGGGDWRRADRALGTADTSAHYEPKPESGTKPSLAVKAVFRIRVGSLRVLAS